MSDILILGATGFTGNLIARYLVNHPQRTLQSFTIALGGRSRHRLNKVAASLGLSADSDSIVVVDLSDYKSVEIAVVRAKVVINAIGPYWTFGGHVVRACALHGIHYVDVAPGPHFVAFIVRKFDFVAFKTDALIIPACGFNSVPSDVAVYVSNRYMKSVLGPETSVEDSVTAYDVQGGSSGSSAASIMSFVEGVPRDRLIKSVADYTLRRPHGPPSRPTRYVYKLPYDASSSWFGAIWPQRMINRQTVHHSWSLFERNKDAHPENAYGDKFKYDECLKTPGPISALFVGLSAFFFIVGLLISPIRRVLKWILPQFDTRPSSDEGHFEVVNVAKAGSLTVKTTFKGEGELEYYATARMVSEAALAIVLNFDELPYPKAGGGGVLTPVTALGDVLIRRLEEFAGMTISSESIKSGESE